MVKNYVSHDEVIQALDDALRSFETKVQVKPDLIIGVGRGGLIPATYVSYSYDAPMTCMMIKSYDKHQQTYKGKVIQHPVIPREAKNILIVDDINDTGYTFKFIKGYFDNLCVRFDGTPEPLNLHFLSVFGKPHTVFESYVGAWHHNDEWVVFPWDELNISKYE